MKIGHVAIKVRKYSDGRWGFDDYSQGKRKMVRVLSKEKAEARAGMHIDRAPDLVDLIQKNGFAPVPPPKLKAFHLRGNFTTIPKESGIYFIWEGAVVAYVGQSINLAQRLKKHSHLHPDDKISYLCIDRSKLFYHEAFYIGICRPLRNGGSKMDKNKGVIRH